MRHFQIFERHGLLRRLRARGSQPAVRGDAVKLQGVGVRVRAVGGRIRHRFPGGSGVRPDAVQRPPRHRLQPGEDDLPKRLAADATERHRAVPYIAKQQGPSGAGRGGGLPPPHPRRSYNCRGLANGRPLAAAQLPRHRHPRVETPHRRQFVRVVATLTSFFSNTTYSCLHTLFG